MTASEVSRILQQFIAEKCTPQIRTLGNRLFSQSRIDLINIDPSNQVAEFLVSDETKSKLYTTVIYNYLSPQSIYSECRDFKTEGITRFEIAAILKLQELLISGQIPIIRRQVQYNQQLTVINMEAVDEAVIRTSSSREGFEKGKKWAGMQLAGIVSAANFRVDAKLTVPPEPQEYHITIIKSSENRFETSCNCNETDTPLCSHKVALLLQIGANDPYYFDGLCDRTAEKNQLLAEYGFSEADDLEGKFAFELTKGKLKLILLDSSIQKLANYQNWSLIQRSLGLDKQFILPSAKVDYLPDLPLLPDHAIGYVIKIGDFQFPNHKIIPIIGRKEFEDDGCPTLGGNISVFEPSQPQTSVSYSEADKELLLILQLVDPVYLRQLIDLKKNNPSRTSLSAQAAYFSEPDREFLQPYLIEKYRAIFKLLSEQPYVFLVRGQQPINRSFLEPIKVSPTVARVNFELSEAPLLLVLKSFIQIGNETYPLEQFRFIAPCFVEKEKYLYLLEHFEDADTVQYFLESPELKFHIQEKNNLFQNLILPLQRKYRIKLPDDFYELVPTPAIEAAVYLNETEDGFLLITPVFNYGGEMVYQDGNTEILLAETSGTEKLQCISRNLDIENGIVKIVQDTHPVFESQQGNAYFRLSFNQAMQGSWFLHFNEVLTAHNIKVLGFQSLKRFRYNPHRPTLKTRIGSGVDWFDIKIEVRFGNELVQLKDLRKAILKKQDYIELSDGTIGILPKEWIEKYARIFRFGKETKTESLQLSSVHFTLIDELYEQIDDQSIRADLDRKRLLLQQSSESQFAQIPLPENLKAELRPYQHASYNWLNFLDSVNWGGCLADDMGLGKTLQTLVFLCRQIILYPNISNLVVAPRTLMFNWENEIAKFCPHISYMIHHGPSRTRDPQQFGKTNLVLTTYGTMRSDVEILASYNFNYIVLDESQAIKSPDSQVTKAAQLLRARNRIILTGTPIQNNTFDLFAQMNFINPGMLGSNEVFKTEYAIPIDKHQDKNKIEELRRLIYPFFLRRSKEQVAGELPEKTETILYCVMEGRQRKVYEAYRNDIRMKLMRQIEEEGIAKASMYVLQGLMKLRQICDSPALLNDTEYYGDDSIKLEELMRELEENIGNHKVLVFSQFLGMLAMIRNQLRIKGWDHEYLDGSTTDRKTCVERFQNSPECRIFLISLTAGGLGLNLTAADYVYLVDPWWNPAVEQQAIDRTHRIGQTKQIFAYKMICKDSIEEKILMLQQKKKGLASELVSEDIGFVKKLTREDIDYLFS